MSFEEERDLLQLKELYQECIAGMLKLVENVETSNKRTLIGRGVGTGVSVVGTGGLIASTVAATVLTPIIVVGSVTLAPFLAVVGVAAGLLGVGVVTASKIAKQLLTKAFISEWTTMDEALRKAAKRSEDTLTRITNKAKVLQEEGNAFEAAIAYIIYCMKNRMKWENVEAHVLSEKIKEFVFIRNMSAKLNRDANLKSIAGGIQGAANFGGIAVAGAGVAIPLIDEIGLGFLQVGRNVVPVARIIASSVGIGVGVIFNVIDIVDLVQAVKTEDEFVAKLQKGIEDYINNIVVLDEYLKLFHSEE